MRVRLAILVATCGLVAACASGTGGVVQIGPDIYMLGGQGGYFDLSGSAVKARYFQDAARFCEGRGLTMVPMNSSGQDAGMGALSAAEVQFKCVKGRLS